MADFCQQCSIEMFGEDGRDLAELCKDGEKIMVLCEGCGPTFVDHAGRCIEHKHKVCKIT